MRVSPGVKMRLRVLESALAEKRAEKMVTLNMDEKHQRRRLVWTPSTATY